MKAIVVCVVEADTDSFDELSETFKAVLNSGIEEAQNSLELVETGDLDCCEDELALASSMDVGNLYVQPYEWLNQLPVAAIKVLKS